MSISNEKGNTGVCWSTPRTCGSSWSGDPVVVPVETRMLTIRAKAAPIPGLAPDQSGGWKLIPVKLSPHCSHGAFKFTPYGSISLYSDRPRQRAAACKHHLCLRGIMELIQTPVAPPQHRPFSLHTQQNWAASLTVVTLAANMNFKPTTNRRHEFFLSVEKQVKRFIPLIQNNGYRLPHRTDPTTLQKLKRYTKK